MFATWAPTSPVANVTTDASYSIYNGSTLLATVVENQQTLPAGGTFNNVAFQFLGTYNITGSLLRVQLNNKTNGVVLADAVAIEKAVPGGDLSISDFDSAGGSSTTGAIGTDTAAGSITYTITVSNSGPGQVLGATVADTFPSSISSDTFVAVATGGATGFTASGSGNILDTVNLPSGATITYTVTATFTASASSKVTDTATVTPPGTFVDSNTADNTASDSDTVIQPEVNVGVTMTDNVGGSAGASGFASEITSLHTFAGTSVNGSNGGVSDGSHPEGDLITDNHDVTRMFGVTQTGGAFGFGSVYEINTDGTGYQTLFSFDNADGATPWGSLDQSADGATLYGTTEFGGAFNEGTVFAMPVGGGSINELILSGGLLGGNPLAGPMYFHSGNPGRDLLFVTTSIGGEFGSGEVFWINLDTSPWTVSPFGAFGIDPATLQDNGEFSYGNVLMDTFKLSTVSQADDTYTVVGTTYSGGANGFGEVFSATYNGGGPSFLNDVLPVYSFTDGADGGNPFGGLSFNESASLTGGEFFGTASTGGANGDGTVYTVNDDGTGFNTVYTFSGFDGATPVGDLQPSANGLDLFGVTRFGGTGNNGTVFGVGVGPTNDGDLEGVFSFPSTGSFGLSGSQPIGGLDVYGPTIYGTTWGGGPSNSNNGEMFALSPPEIVPGNDIDYQLTITNSGPGDASDTSIQDLLKSNPSIATDLTGDSFTAVGSGGASGFTAKGIGDINDIVDLPAFSSITYTIVADVSPLAVGFLTNTARVTTGPGEINLNPNAVGNVVQIQDQDLISTASAIYGGQPGNLGGSAGVASLALSKGTAGIAEMSAATVANGTNVGTVKANSGSVVETYTIKNNGTGALDLTGPISISGTGFILLSQPSVTSLAAGASVTFQIEFLPTKVGEDSATVTINSNDPTNPLFRFQLIGTAD